MDLQMDVLCHETPEVKVSLVFLRIKSCQSFQAPVSQLLTGDVLPWCNERGSVALPLQGEETFFPRRFM